MDIKVDAYHTCHASRRCGSQMSPSLRSRSRPRTSRSPQPGADQGIWPVGGSRDDALAGRCRIAQRQPPRRGRQRARQKSEIPRPWLRGRPSACQRVSRRPYGPTARAGGHGFDPPQYARAPTRCHPPTVHPTDLGATGGALPHPRALPTTLSCGTGLRCRWFAGGFASRAGSMDAMSSRVSVRGRMYAAALPFRYFFCRGPGARRSNRDTGQRTTHRTKATRWVAPRIDSDVPRVWLPRPRLSRRLFSPMPGQSTQAIN